MGMMVAFGMTIRLVSSHFLEMSCGRYTKVADFVINCNWNFAEIKNWVDPEIVKEISQTDLLANNSPDKSIWTPTSKGEFTLALTFQLVQSFENKPWVYEIQWMEHIPITISFFCRGNYNKEFQQMISLRSLVYWRFNGVLSIQKENQLTIFLLGELARNYGNGLGSNLRFHI